GICPCRAGLDGDGARNCCLGISSYSRFESWGKCCRVPGEKRVNGSACGGGAPGQVPKKKEPARSSDHACSFQLIWDLPETFLIPQSETLWILGQGETDALCGILEIKRIRRAYAGCAGVAAEPCRSAAAADIKCIEGFAADRVADLDMNQDG